VTLKWIAQQLQMGTGMYAANRLSRARTTEYQKNAKYQGLTPGVCVRATILLAQFARATSSLSSLDSYAFTPFPGVFLP
jgi:hypothetical protein